MGRPLNKKYFGNRNIGTNGNQVDESAGGSANAQNYADDRIGGEGIAGVTFGASVADTSYGSGAYLNRMPHITAIGAPTIPGGVQAVADVTHVKAVHAVQHARGTGYQINDIIEGTTGTGTKARFKVTKLKVVDITVDYTTTGTNWDGGEWVVWDGGVDTHWESPTILKSVTIGGAGGHRLTGLAKGGAGSYGVWNGTDGHPAPVLPQPIVGGNNTPNPATNGPSYNTRGDGDYNGPTNDPVNDNNASGATVTFTWGIEEVVVLSGLQGDYTAVDAAAQAVTNLTAGPGTNATLDIFYGVKTITVSEKGSGYKGTETVTFTAQDGIHNETTAVGTIVLTTDSGAVGSATNQENAIVIYANIAGAGAVVGDIIRQVSTRRYKVRTAAGVGIVELESGDNTPNAGKAMIIATDSDSNTYYVTKLTAHRATLTRKTFVSLGQWQFESDQSAPWKFFEGQANADVGYVKIENA
jgi:hypothetical protein